ncbi:unnamed protein product [Mytilus coruscus]|uniref:Ig-like domain-containing protein n=1 Tax=Mytilus coruscus TaxID=42192 RepID=A0A6J8EXY3_MYTCO|nr:unnamed protein product [Mytilus coruscus]
MTLDLKMQLMMQIFLIALTAVDCALSSEVVVIGEDTDLLVLLIHHVNQQCKRVIFKSDKMAINKKMKIWNIQQTEEFLGEDNCNLLPFLHSLTGCDSTSRLFGIGKGLALKKLNQEYLKMQGKVFMNNNSINADIIKAGEEALTCLYGGLPLEGLNILRWRKFTSRVITGNISVQVKSLPPTSDSGQFHSLRVYHQCQKWMSEEVDMDPTDYGWEIKRGKFCPILMELPPAPDKLLNIIRCNCKQNCDTKRCVCRKSSVFGRKYVLKPNPTEVDCFPRRYQPFTFSSVGNNQCVFSKSFCQAKGLTAASNGTTINDRTCRCDYRRNYDYIIRPKDPCSCKPAEEDCSCYIRKCEDGKVMIADYRCVQRDSIILPEDIKCTMISDTGSHANVTTNTNNTFVDQKEHSSTSAFTALISILNIMIITVVLTLMIWVSLNIKVMSHITETKGISEKDRIIYIEDGTPKIYHVIEGDNFTIRCEIRSLIPVKSVRWQRDGCDINSQSPEYKLNDPMISLTIENLSASHTGNYRCLVSNYFGFNNTTVDRCVNYLSALHRRMTWIQTLHQFKACNKEDQNAITINVHSLPTVTEYKLVEKPRGDKVTLNPVSEDIAYVVWFYKTEDILSALKPDQYSYKKDRSVKAEQNEDTKNDAEEAMQHGDTKDGAAKAMQHGDTKDEAAKAMQHGDTKDGAAKAMQHGDTKDGAAKAIHQCDTKDGAAKVMHHHDTKDGAVTEQKVDINAKETPNIHALVFKTALSDNGQYGCFVVTAMKKIVSYGWNLKVIPQVKTYEEVLKHRKDTSYVKTPTVDKAVECLKNNGFVVIVGRKGTGKSKMCLQLESIFEQTDYLPFEVKEILDLREITDMADDLKSTKILFSVDDSDYSPDSLDKRLSLLPEVSDNSKAKVIFTCTQTGLPMIKNILKKWKLYSDKAMIDLDNDANILPLEVKKEILERLSKSMSVKLDVDLVNTIINTKPFYGFPFVANKFCSDRKHLKKREKYFTNPPKSLRKEIKDLYISSLERKKQDLMNTYCILVYVSIDKSHCLDSSNTDFARIQQIKKIIYDYTAVESPLDAIAVNDIAESLVGKYLVKSDDHTYKFIHPAVLKAVFLSSEYFTKYIVEEGGKEDIIDYIRSEQYEVLEGELVLKLETKTYPALCIRLLNLLLERPHFGEKIGDYIYHHFISLHDQNFLKTFFLNLEKYFPLQIVMEKENKILEKCGSIREKKTKVNKESAFVNITDFGKTKTSQSSPLPMIRMFEHLTRSGRDSWIFTVDEVSIPDFGILYGLIMACKNNFCNDEDQEKTFKIILAFFRKRCEKKDFQLNLFAHMDIYSNVFCHFLALFCETESCLILEELLKWFPESKFELKKRYSEKIPYKVKNILSESPMKMSVYLGKANLFKLIWQKTNSKEKKRIEDLLNAAEIGMELSYGSGSSTSEVKSFLNLDKDFSQLVLRGEKDGYIDIIKTLKNMLQQKQR